MLTREDWLEETKKEFNRNEVTLHDNAKCTLENEHIVVFEQKYAVSYTHLTLPTNREV